MPSASSTEQLQPGPEEAFEETSPARTRSKGMDY